MSRPPWDHNVQYHGLLLRHCPPGTRRALDVGCGLGDLARRLAGRAEAVDAIDVDAPTLAEAVRRTDATNVRFANADVLTADLPTGAYDVVTAVAVLHHMDLRSALERVHMILRPGGTFAALGLHRDASPVDLAYGVASLALDPFYLAWHRPKRAGPTAPLRRPELSLRQIADIATDVMPGSRVRRHLFWRHSLIWRKPGG